MKNNLFRILFFFAPILVITAVYLRVNCSEIWKKEKETESPNGPYEDFMLQRIYPNSSFDFLAYKSALNQAALNNQQPHFRRNSNSSTNWTLEGPGNIGGRFNCMAINPLNHNVMYAGSANGGVWKTNNNAGTWFPVFDSIAYLAIGAIAINPSDTSEIWVGTGDLNISGTMYTGNGLYKSTDAGNSWSNIGLSDTYVISSIVFNTANTNEVLVATMGNQFARDTNRGIYRTTNGGLNFTNVNFVNDSTGFIDMQQDPVNGSVVYACSFSRLRTNANSVFNGTEVYVFKSVNFGQSWNILSGGLPNGMLHERLGICIFKSNPDILYALYSTSDGSNPGLYKSTNGGNSWNQILISQFNSWGYGTFGWYFGKIYCDPVNSDLLYIPAVDLQYSMDGGANWDSRTSFSTVNVHADGHFMNFLSRDSIIYCTDGGIYKTTDAGFDWTDFENIPNNQFYAVTENKNSQGIYAGGVQDNGTMFGNASGINNFTKIYGGDGFTVAYTNNPFLIYTESQNGNIVYDDNFPSGFYSIQLDGSQNYNWHTPYFLSPYSDDTLYFAGQSVMRIDGAPYGNYTIISPVLHDPGSPQRVSNISTINQSRLSSQILYAGTADGKVWRSLNAGNVWDDITPFQGSSYYVTRVMPSPNDASIVYVTRSGYRSNDNTPLIFKSVNNGSSWVSITGDLPMLAVNDIEIYPGSEDIIFIANDAGVYATIDGGVHWERVGANMPFVAVLDIHFNYNYSKLIAGTFGRSIYTINVMSMLTSAPLEVIANLVKIYPSPVMDYISIDSPMPIESYSIYSMQGKAVSSGSRTLIDVTKLKSGNYFLKLKLGSNEVVRRFVKL